MISGSEEQELKERLSLIENMLAEGRQRTENWGWSFVLWGLAYYVAIAWATWGRSNVAWPVTMLSAAALTAIISSRRPSHPPETTIGRAIVSIWIAIGVSLFVVCMGMAASGHAEIHVFLAVVEVMLGAANATSGLILRWKTQFACAVVWWAAALASCFGTVSQSFAAFMVAIFLCQIVFGIYMSISEARGRRQSQSKGAAHA